MIRLFIALKIEEEIQQKFDAIISDFQTKGGKVKWVAGKNQHITLKFLGNTEFKIVDVISSQLRFALQKNQAIESEFTTLGGFPNLRKPKVIWADIEKNKNSVIELAQQVESSLSEINFDKSDKPFKPHLTLGRVKSYEELENLTDYLTRYSFEKIPVLFKSVLLIQSKLTQQGPIYKVLDEIELADRFGG